MNINIFLTRENITLVIAIIGCIGTISTWICSYMSHRQNLDIRVLGHLIPEGYSVILYVMLENKSQLPISITGISVCQNEILYPCQEIPIKVYETTTRKNKEIVSHNEYFSMPNPIFLPSLCGTSGYVYFEAPQEVFPPDATQLTLRLTTNRGKVVEKTLSLGELLD